MLCLKKYNVNHKHHKPGASHEWLDREKVV